MRKLCQRSCTNFIKILEAIIGLSNMKSKLTNKEKVPTLVGSPKNTNAAFKKQFDSKAGVPKTKSTLTSCKSAQNLRWKQYKESETSIELPDESLIHTFNSEIKEAGSKEHRIEKRQATKKAVGGKGSQFSAKSPTSSIWRGRNTATDKMQDKTKKFVNEKDEKFKKLTDKNLELEEKITLMLRQKQKTDQILQFYQQENQKLEAKLDSLKNVSLENRRLIKQKASVFNQQGSELIEMKKQLEELKSQNIQQPKQSFKNSSTQTGSLETISFQIQTEDQQTTFEESKSLSVLNNSFSGEYIEHLSDEIKDYYEAKLKAKDDLIEQQRQLLHEQNLELNELYQRIQMMKEGASTQLLIFGENKKKYDLAGNSLQEQLCQNHDLMMQVNSLNQEVYRLQCALQAKDICIKHFTNNESQLINSEMEANTKLKQELEEEKKKISEYLHEVEELRQRVSQQEAIMRNLKEKKPRVIIK